MPGQSPSGEGAAGPPAADGRDGRVREGMRAAEDDGATDGGPLVRLRAVWAGMSFTGARAAAGRVIGAAIPARRADGDWLGDGAALALAGRLSVDPLSGAVFRDGRPLSPPWGAPGPPDWLVRAFPSRQSFPEVAPLWFGPRPDVVAALAEALPRRVALDRLAPAAVGLVGVGLGRLDAMQEALSAGVFAPGAVKVQPWDKVIHATRVVWPAPGFAPDDLREAGRRLRAAYGSGPEGAVMLVTGGEARAARLWPDWRETLAREGARLLDPERTPLAVLVPALAGARRLIAPDSGEAALGLVRRGPLSIVLGRSERPDGRGAAVAAALGWHVETAAGDDAEKRRDAATSSRV
jgi:hypothetical protein